MQSDIGCSQRRICIYSNNRNAHSNNREQFEQVEFPTYARMLSAQTANTLKQYHQSGSEYIIIIHSVSPSCSKLTANCRLYCRRRGFCGSSKWRPKFQNLFPSPNQRKKRRLMFHCIQSYLVRSEMCHLCCKRRGISDATLFKEATLRKELDKKRVI